MNPIKNLKNNFKNPSFRLGFIMMGIVYILMTFNIVPSSFNSVWITLSIWGLITITYEAFKPKHDIENQKDILGDI